MRWPDATLAIRLRWETPSSRISPLDCGRPVHVLEVRCRTSDGTLRPAAAVDADVGEAVSRAVEAGRRVLLTLVDVSKTGLLAPSPACAEAWKRRFPEKVEVFGRRLPVPARPLDPESLPGARFSGGRHRLEIHHRPDLLRRAPGSRGTGAAAQVQDASPRPALVFGPGRLAADVGGPCRAEDNVELRPVVTLGGGTGGVARFSPAAGGRCPEFPETFRPGDRNIVSRTIPLSNGCPVPRSDRGPLATAESWDHLPHDFFPSCSCGMAPTENVSG